MKLRQLIPMLESDDLPGTILFYTEVLGFEIFDIAEDENGPYWVNLNRDKVEIMFTTRNAHSKEARATINGVMYFYPDDVNALWEELKDKVKVEWEPQDFGYGMWDFGIRDNNGFLLNFGQPIEELKG